MRLSNSCLFVDEKIDFTKLKKWKQGQNRVYQERNGLTLTIMDAGERTAMVVTAGSMTVGFEEAMDGFRYMWDELCKISTEA